MVLGEGYIKYSDLISKEDCEFWSYLCKKDFVRLQKLMGQNLGEGHFFDDSDSEDSDSEKPSKPGKNNRDPRKRVP